MENKLLILEDLLPLVERIRERGKRVVFTNGCFDILHVGHTRYLALARRHGDALIVGVNSDSSVRRIKGQRRPIVKENERAEMLSSLKVVDFVVIFAEETPARLISLLRPDVIVKGGDWKQEDIVGADMVASWGGQVVIAPLVEGSSTTGIVERVLAAYREG